MLLSNKMLYDAIFLFKAKSKNTRNMVQKLSKANNKNTRKMSNYRPWTGKWLLGVNKKLPD